MKHSRLGRSGRYWISAAAVGTLTLLGCASQDRPLNDAVFYQAPTPVQPAEPVDEPGAVHPRHRQGTPAPQPAPPEPSVQEISPTVSQAVKSPAEQARSAAPSTRSSTAPTATTQSFATGQYVTIGAVVAEVNGVPIYADQVLAWVERDLAAKARELNPQAFRQYALQQLNKSRDYFINNELIFAAAQRSLNARERELAESLTTAWRRRQITEAGGSIELARQKAAAEGLNFNDLVKEQYRTFMAQIYYQKKIMPRIQISARDLREYYAQHIKDEFTEHDQVRFRLIKIDPREVGGRDAAIQRVKEIQEKAARGFDFAELAKTQNRDPLLQRNAGDVGWVDKGAFRLEKVEQAVWNLQPGEVTQSFVEEDGAFYVAKLEERKLGRVAPFEDPSVQDAIHQKLRAQQFQALQDRTMEALKRDAIIDLKNDNLNITLEMAMQRYPRWHQP